MTTRKYTITDPTDPFTVIYDGDMPWMALENGVYPCEVSFDDTDRTFIGTAFVQSNFRDDFKFAAANSHFQFDRYMAAFVAKCTENNLFRSVKVEDYGVNSMTLIVTRHDGMVFAVCDHHGWATDEMGFTGVEYGTRDGLVIAPVTLEGDYAEPVGDPRWVPTYSPADLVHAIGTY